MLFIVDWIVLEGEERSVKEEVAVPYGLIFTDKEKDSWITGGLSLQERMLRTLQKAGITEVLRLGSDAEAIIQYLASHQAPVLCLTSTILIDYRLIEDILAFPLRQGEAVMAVASTPESPPAPASDSSIPLLLLCSASLVPLLVEALRQGAKTFAACLAYIQERSTIQVLPLQGKWGHPITDAASIQQAEEWLFNSLVKETDSPVTKMINRKISLRVSRLLVPTGITPNQITLLCLLIGLGGAALLTIPHQGARVTGALLFLLSTILDGCDGEIARLKFLESRYGGWLDLLCDNLIHIALFMGIGLGLYREYQEGLYIALGGIATIGVIASVFIVSYGVLRRKKGAGPLFISVVEEREAPKLKPFFRFLAKVADLLGRRDFSYILVLLTLLGKVEWFLWAGALGTNLYFLLLLSIYSWGRVVSLSSVADRE